MSAEYIKREDAIKAVEARGVERQYGYGRTDYDQGRNDEISYISDVVLPEVPAADVAPVVHARWDEAIIWRNGCFWVCSNCKFPSEASAAPKLYKYCPSCGAKMDLEVETDGETD